MQKRILSTLLAVSMLLALLPAIALPVVAADTVTVTFINANVTPNVTVDTQVITPAGDGTMTFTIPEAPTATFGWYAVSANGSLTEASAFLGTAAKDMTFYAVAYSAPFAPATNWPLYSGESTFIGFRGGWSVGAYTGLGVYQTMQAVSKVNDIYLQLKAGGLWSTGGLSLNRSAYRLVTPDGNGSAVSLSYTVPESGRVNIDFNTLGIHKTSDGSEFSDIAMAIAVNGKIVWPASAKGDDVTNKPVTMSGSFTFPIYHNASTAKKGVIYSSVETDWTYLSLGDRAATLAAYKSGFTAEQEQALNATLTDWSTTANLKNASVVAAAQKTKAQTGSYLDAYHAYCKKNGYPHDIAVSTGDRVDIVFSNVHTIHVDAVPVVTYMAFSAPAPSATTLGSLPATTTTEGAMPVFKNGWSFVSFDKNGQGEPTYSTAKTSFPYNKSGQNHPLWREFFNWDNASTAAFKTDATSSHNWGTAGSVIVGTGKVAGYRYTAPASGYVDIDIDTLLFFRYIDHAKKTISSIPGMVSVAIYVDGIKKWPAGDAWYSATSTDQMTTGNNDKTVHTVNLADTAMNAAKKALSGLYVAKGGTVDLLVRNNYTANPTGDLGTNSSGEALTYAGSGKSWAARGTVFSAQITYVGLASSPSSLDSLPATSATNGEKPTFPHDWSFVSFDKSSQGEPVTSTMNVDFSYNTTFCPLWKKSFNWDDPKTAAFKASNANAYSHNWGELGSVIVGNATVAGYRYTAPMSGYVDIDIDTLLFFRYLDEKDNKISSVPGLISVAIYVDGAKVWPQEGWYSATSVDQMTTGYRYADSTVKAAVPNNMAAAAMANAGNALSGVFVSEGSTIDLLVRNNYTADPTDLGTDSEGDPLAFAGNGKSWAARGTVFSANVVYQSALPLYADIQASLELGKAFAISTSVESLQTYTIKLDGETILSSPGVTSKSLTDIAARSLHETHSYEIWRGTLLLRKGSFSVNTLLKLYAQSADETTAALAKATLLYGAAANVNFNDGAVLSDEDASAMAALAVPDASKTASITEVVEEAVAFKNANIYLNDVIEMKITFKALEGKTVTAPQLQVTSENGTVKGMVDVALVGDVYEAIFEVPMAAYNEGLQISVWEGTTQISDTLHYGVNVYANRVYSQADASVQNVLKTILALGTAAEAYVTAHPAQ